MFMIKYFKKNLLSLGLIGELWVGQILPTGDIINGKCKLIETAGFLFLKSCNVKVEAIVLAIIQI